MVPKIHHLSARRRAGVLVVALALVMAGPHRAPAAQSLEYPIKAAFLVKFGEFVQWPAQAFQASGGVFNICIVGDPSFAAIVGAAVQNETVAGRKVSAHGLAGITADSACHIAYLAGSAAQPPAEALRVLAGKPVLTVTDESRGPNAGMVHFMIRNNRVRFAIDDAAAAAGGLTLSSALLNIAVSVRRRN
ncbi:MAG: YfiR family protein [Rhodospirillaceae bacterium]